MKLSFQSGAAKRKVNTNNYFTSSRFSPLPTQLQCSVVLTQYLYLLLLSLMPTCLMRERVLSRVYIKSPIWSLLPNYDSLKEPLASRKGISCTQRQMKMAKIRSFHVWILFMSCHGGNVKIVH